MRILIGGFVAECNAYVDKPMMLEDFSITRGDAVADILYVREPAAECGVELVPSLMAYGGGGGRVDGAAFEYILTQFKNAVKEHLHDIDGMFFFFHGASSVIDLEGDSGDHAGAGDPQDHRALYAAGNGYGPPRKPFAGAGR